MPHLAPVTPAGAAAVHQAPAAAEVPCTAEVPRTAEVPCTADIRCVKCIVLAYCKADGAKPLQVRIV
jgi:hypothetical protein